MTDPSEKSRPPSGNGSRVGEWIGHGGIPSGWGVNTLDFRERVGTKFLPASPRTPSSSRGRDDYGVTSVRAGYAGFNRLFTGKSLLRIAYPVNHFEVDLAILVTPGRRLFPRHALRDRLMTTGRQGFGIDALDRLLGGGLLPGTLTVVAGRDRRGQDAARPALGRCGTCRRGASRGDLRPDQPRRRPEPRAAMRETSSAGTCRASRATPRSTSDSVWDFERPIGDYFHPFGRAGRRVTRRDLEPDDWHAWKTDLARVLRTVGRLLLRALRPGGAPGRRRRDRADRAVRRLDPVRVLRVSLSPGPPQGGRVGGARALPRAIPRQQPRGLGPSLRPPGRSAASTSTRPPTSCSTT